MRRSLAMLTIATVACVSTGCEQLGDATSSLPLIGSHADGRLDARPHAPAVAPPTPGRHDLEIDGHRVLLYVHTSAVGSRPSTFALLLHGASGSAEGGFRMWAPYAERAGTILLAPQSQHGGAWDV